MTPPSLQEDVVERLRCIKPTWDRTELMAGLAEDDAIQLAKDKRAEALAKLEAAQTEFHQWDVTHARLLAAWANKYCDRPASEAHKEGRE